VRSGSRRGRVSRSGKRFQAWPYFQVKPVAEKVTKANEPSSIVGAEADSGPATDKNLAAFKKRPTTVSVVMATYNGEQFLRAQLDSILQCLHEVDQLVVIDDCSTDGTLQILREVRWRNLVLIRNPSNLGVRKSFGLGLQQAKGDIVFLSDQDDLWTPGKRDAFVAEFAADALCSIVISDASVVDADGQAISPSFMQLRGGFRGDVASNFVRNRFIGCAMAMRASMIRVALPIPESAPLHDVYLGMIGSLTGTVRYLETPYLLHRRHGGNASPSSRTGWMQVLTWRLGLLRALVEAASRPGMRQAMLDFRMARRRLS
jgi:glycosyltransferase involved in cell wall biosynthesis